MNTDRIDGLVKKVHGLTDSDARGVAIELVQAVMELHASALERMLATISSSEDGESIINAFAADDLVSGVLLLHDLHPLDLETRVLRALKGRAELISIRDGTVRVRIEGGAALKEEVESALNEAAPDAAAIIVEGATSEGNGFVPLSKLFAG